MSSGFANTLWSLIGVLVLISQWVGLMAMRGQKGKGWLLMVIGTSISSLGPGYGMLASIGAFRSEDAIWFGTYTLEPTAFALGGLLFGWGFVVHGLALKAAGDRRKELEALSAAMAEELLILRHG